MLKSKLENLFNRFNKKHYYSLAGILLLVVIGVFFVVTPAQALVEEVANGMIRFASWLFLGLARLAIGFTIFALEFFIKVAQYNNYVDAPTVLVGWVMVRDVANMFFVIALLLIAFGTMMGMENYMWTKTLVKLILAAVFINFSNLICGIFIDIAHVFTITFVNAIAGAAGGNVIKMLHLQEVLTMVGETGDYGGDLQLDVLISAIAGFIFAAISAATMIAYLVVMVARLVVLWVLIVLSPLAFALQTIPQTEQYAKEWWQKFGKQVIVAPVMVFFLWLAFATVGAGNIATQQALAPGAENLADVQKVMGTEVNQPKLSLSSATTWDNMANFLIPIALLIVGLNVVQQIGVVGGGMVGGVVNFGKKVATIASGYAAGRWLTGAAGKGLKAAAWYAPVIGGEKWATMGKTVWENVKTSYARAGAGITPANIKAAENLAAVGSELSEIETKLQKANEPGSTVSVEEKAELTKKRDALKEKEQEYRTIMDKDRGNAAFRAMGWFARRSVSTKKHYKKSQGQAEVMQKILWKRVGAEAGGWIFNRKNKDVDAQDRVERGILEAEEMRGKAKDEEFIGRGRAATLAASRQKYAPGIRGQKETYPPEKTISLAEAIAGHEARAEGWKGKQLAVLSAGRIKVDMQAKVALDDLRNRAQAEKWDGNKMHTELQKLFSGKDGKFVEALYYKEMGKTTEAAAKSTATQTEAALENYEQVPWTRYLGGKRRLLQMEKEREGTVSRFNEVKETVDKFREEGLNDKEISKMLSTDEEKRFFDLIQRGVTPDSLSFMPAEWQQRFFDAEADAAQQPHQETMRMRIERYARAGEAAESYFKSVKRNAPRTNEAADEIADYKSEIESLQQELNREEDPLKRRELESRLATTQSAFDNFIKNDEYASNIFWEQAAKVSDQEVQAARSKTLSGIIGTEIGQDFIKRIADAEIGTKISEELIKNIKNAHLASEFEEAAQKMKEWAELSRDEAKKRTDVALKDKKESVYVQVMGLSQRAKMEEEASGIRRRQAEDAAHDAFVAKPRYGITTPSSALSEYADSKMKDYKKLDRAAAMKKAADMMASLQLDLKRGKKLTIDQIAEQFAASAVLQEEAWNDDQNGYMFQMFKKLQSGQLQGEEAEKWENMAKNFYALGWLGDENDGFFTSDGKINKNYKIKAKYDRKYAADLQGMAITGGDVDLLRAHHAVSAAVDENLAEQEDVAKKAKDEELDKLLISDKHRDGVAEIARKTYDAAIKDGKNHEDAMTDAREAGRRMVEQAEKNHLEQVAKQAAESVRRGYFEIAQEILPKLNIRGIANREQLKTRYDQYADFMQDATKSNKANALKTGHEELGYNQDFDEDEDVYRFQTEEEGRSKMRAERVKYEARKLLNSDQFHSNGVLHQDAGIIDDFYEDVLSLTLGKVTRLIELTGIPERSLKGYFYLHKNEAAVVDKSKKDGKKMAIVGGSVASGMLSEKGITSSQDQAEHMIKHGLLAELLSGAQGFSVALSKLYTHTSEKDAQGGIINLRVAGSEQHEFRTVRELATYIERQIVENPNYLKGTRYERQANDVRRRLQSIISKDFRSSGSGGEEPPESETD